MTPMSIVQTVEDWPEPGPYVGREAVMRFVEQLRGTWDADAVEATSDFIDAADRVVVRFIWHGVGHGPAGEYGVHGRRSRFATARSAVMEFFWNHAEALEAAGLQE